MTATVRIRALVSSRPDRIALANVAEAPLRQGREGVTTGHAPSTKEKEHGREDSQKEFMDEQVRQRDEDESHMQDKAR